MKCLAGFREVLMALMLCLIGVAGAYAGGVEPIQLSGAGNNAHSPFFTRDHKGNPVVCWLEQEEGAKEAVMYFAVSYDQGISFGKAVKIPASLGANPSGGECPPKVAFKKDGTIVAVYRKSLPVEGNPYAGDIFQVISGDGGKSWSAPVSVNPGAGVNTSGGFFDLEALPDGQVGVIWLEGRAKDDLSGRGSALKFSSSTEKGGFGKAVTISENSCQCCKTKLFADAGGMYHVVFREIYTDQARDISHSYSSDAGKSFSMPVNISQDKWYLQGCPHVGPDVDEVNGRLQFTWFTMGGGAGIYMASQTGGAYSGRKAVVETEKASRPQLAALENGGTVLVWEELMQGDGKYIQRVGVRINPLGKTDSKNLYLRNFPGAHHPVVITLGKQFAGLAFTLSSGKNDKVFYLRMDTSKPGEVAEKTDPVVKGDAGFKMDFTH